MQKKIYQKFRKILFRSILNTLFILAFVVSVMAQERTINGAVTTSDTKETLPGASIVIKGTTIGTITDINGNYSLKVAEGQDTLVFSYVGYETQEVDIKGRNLVNVELQIAKVSLEEVVVIGYGTVRKSDLTGSVSSIKADDITKITAVNPMQSLQGRISGVQITSPSGTPGESPIVRVRGVGTFNNSNPIYVVDGVILDDISFLNAADIASMEVLKDASATAIYGSRGANGVIMVTTKSGQAAEGKTQFTFTGEYGMQRLAKKIDLLNGKEFATIANEIKPGSYNNTDLVPNTDWQDLIFDVAPVQNYQLSASGASKSMQYYVGVGYFNQKGIIDKSSYERITIKLNNIYNLTSFLKLGNNITISPFSQQFAPDVTWAAYRAQPVLEPYYPDGSFGVVYNVGNPLASLAYSNNFRKGTRGVGNIYADLNLVKGLTLKSSFGVDASYIKAKNFTPAFTIYNPDGSASQQENVLSDLTKASSDYLSWLWENTLTYDKVFGKNSINAVAGYTMQKTTAEEIRVQGANIIRDGENFWYINPNYIYDPNSNVNTISSISNSVNPGQYYSIISYLFRVNYVFANKYILTGTFRSDGSSKFSEENRYSYFPSFAIGWNISEEAFMKDIDFINKLKLRASWGKVGNEKIDYYARYSRVQSDILAVFGNDIPNSAASYGIYGNPDLRWEVTTQTDVGVELGTLNNRLTAELDYYHKNTDDILVQLSIPGYFGNGQGAKVWYNAAEILNRGFEFNIGWRDQVGQVKYGVRILGSTIHNEVLEIGGNSGIDSVLVGGYLNNGIPVTRSEIGLPVGAFYGYQTDGIFQTQQELDAYPHASDAGVGDLRFVDVNGDGKLNGLDRTYIGSPIPTFIFGFNIDLEYKGFDLSLNIQGQTGNKIFNAKEVVRPDPYNFERHVMDRWTGPGTSDTEPRASFGGYNYNPSDKFIYDGSFVRIRNIILGYTLPQNWSNKIYMQKFRVYVKVDNLYTFTKFTGYTPEIGSGDVLSNGIDSGIYPVTSVYSFGVNLNF
ncbi:MAG: TonB-dependent receptor [Bacteroidales bacterium]|nr:TonB-dependent receptor [Bacteroidales bacterium]